MKKVNVSDLVIGKKYHVNVKGSVWSASELTYVGIQSYRGKQPEYWFTCGSADDWKRQFNFVATKSRLIIKEV